MPRSPLYATTRSAIRLACLAEQNPEAGLAEIVEARRSVRTSRRRFLRETSAATLGLGATGRTARAEADPGTRGRSEPAIAIVGAGLAGLLVAYRLTRAGVPCTVYEASDRLGGRVHTVGDAIAPGLATELGGEFIDTDHRALRRLVRDLGLTLVDTRVEAPADVSQASYFFGDRWHDEAQVIEALRPIVARTLSEREKLDDLIDYRHEGGAGKLDRASLAHYFDRLSVTGWVRQLLDTTWATEYGLDPDRQSALNFILQVEAPTASSPYPLFSEHDERFKIRGGNSRVVEALAGRVATRVRCAHRLEALRPANDGVMLTLAGPNGRSVDVRADVAVVCVPFSTLRGVDLRIDLPPAKRRAIDTLSYGTNAKLVLAFDRPIWRELGRTGRIMTDQPFQSAWDSGGSPEARPSALTLFCGGRRGVELEEGPVAVRANRLTQAIDGALPGASETRIAEKCRRSSWIHDPGSLGSYACYGPGQWTTIAGAEAAACGPLYFAGEHCSVQFQGYMNGAVQSAEAAARALLTRLGRPSRRG